MSSKRVNPARILQGDALAGVATWTWGGAEAPAEKEPEPEPSGGAAAANDIEPAPPPDWQVELEALRRDCQEQVDTARRAAYQDGLREGERQGAAAAVAEVEPVMARLLRTIEDLSATRDEFRREAEEDIVRLSFGIARRILHRELSVDPGALTGVVRAALDKIGARELHRVLVAEQDHAAISAGLAAARLPRRVEVAADPNLERGAVLFETVKGTLDASLETQLDEIERGLVDALKERP